MKTVKETDTNFLGRCSKMFRNYMCQLVLKCSLDRTLKVHKQMKEQTAVTVVVNGGKRVKRDQSSLYYATKCYPS